MGVILNPFTGELEVVKPTTGFLTKSQADTYYYPLSTNPAGYLTSSTAPGAFYWSRTAGFLNPTTLGDQILWNFDGDQQYMGNTDVSKFHIGEYATNSGTLAGLINTAHSTSADFSHYYFTHNVPTPTDGVFTTTDDTTSTSYIVSMSDIGWLDIFQAPAKGGAGAPVFNATPTFSLNMLTGALKIAGNTVQTNASFITNEVPSGLVNGTNVTFTLANTPATGSLAFYVNGQRLKAGGTDFTLSTNTITCVTASPTNSILLADYRI